MTRRTTASTKQAPTRLLRAALRCSMVALDDWLNLYAESECDPKRVQEARRRIHEKGTIGYIADVQQQNRIALRAKR